MLQYNGMNKPIQPTKTLIDFFSMLQLPGAPYDYKWYADGNLINPDFSKPVFSQVKAKQNITLEKIPPPPQAQNPPQNIPVQQRQYSQIANPFQQQQSQPERQAETQPQIQQQPQQPIIKAMPIKKIIQTQLTPIQPVSSIKIERRPQSQIGDKTSGKKNIGQFECEIEDYGNIVNLRTTDGTLNIVLRESQSSPEATQKINLSPNEVSTLEEHILRLNNTKVMFLKGLTGVAVRWGTGMMTKFELYLDEL